MERTGLTVDDMDLIEANEAFAAQSVAVARELGFDMSKVNVNGGAVALGHPVGASGCRILVTLLHEMQKRDAKKGLATLCIGGGMGCATIDVYKRQHLQLRLLGSVKFQFDGRFCFRKLHIQQLLQQFCLCLLYTSRCV